MEKHPLFLKVFRILFSPNIQGFHFNFIFSSGCAILGRIGIVNHDIVELNNLQRQIIHTEAYIGMSKVESAVAACYFINSTTQIVEHKEAFHTSNALRDCEQVRYDVVVDVTDNRPSRYMINDCCVVLGKLTVYNYNGGLCYRCLFPTPLPTVKHILSKGNPHLVYGARVLVKPKPYREKSKL